jgi:ABC-type transport system involved in Fe-S cluster assembly fused permease/ATPase subunit
VNSLIPPSWQYFNNEKMEAERYDKYFAKYSAASLKTNVRSLGIGGAVGSVCHVTPR